MSELNGLTREEIKQGIYDALHPADTEKPDPAKERDDNCRSQFFLRAHADDIDQDTRAAAIRQITAALKNL